MKNDDGIAPYEGLVFKTAQMFHAMIGLEMDDMRQELRVKVWKARQSYDPTRSSMTEKAYVYACVANFVKDLKRQSILRARLRVGHIEDYSTQRHKDTTEVGSLDAFELRYQNATHEEIYGAIDDGSLALPPSVSEQEATVLVYLMLGYAQVEIAEHLCLSSYSVQRLVSSLRVKFADWKPSLPPEQRDAVPVLHADATADQPSRGHPLKLLARGAPLAA